MNINKIIISVSIVVIFIIIVFATSFKVIKKHNEVLIKVTEEKIISSAKKCVLDSKCDSSKIELKTLYELEYIDKINNPITKEYYDESSYVLIEKDNYQFIAK